MSSLITVINFGQWEDDGDQVLDNGPSIGWDEVDVDGGGRMGYCCRGSMNRIGCCMDYEIDGMKLGRRDIVVEVV